MAMPKCMSGDGNEATFLGSFVQTGDQVAVCDECLVGFCAALLNTLTGVDPTPFLQAISTDADPASTAEGAPSDEPPPPQPADADPDADPRPSGRTRRPRATAAAPTGSRGDDD